MDEGRKDSWIYFGIILIIKHSYKTKGKRRKKKEKKDRMQNDLQETSHPDWCANNNVSFNLILITMSFHHSHPRNSPSICSISCCLSSVGWSSFPAHRCTENKKHVIIYASTNCTSKLQHNKCVPLIINYIRVTPLKLWNIYSNKC